MPEKTLTLIRPIVLVGMMAAGKTRIGDALAQTLNVSFIDSDNEIEKAAQLSVTDIFERYGEAEFRQGERRVIHRLLQDKACVLATGGGAFMDKQTHRLIKDKAVSIWLDVEIDELVQRVARKPNKRPLLINTDIRKKLSDLAHIRIPVYRTADIHIEASGRPKAEVVALILAELRARKLIKN